MIWRGSRANTIFLGNDLESKRPFPLEGHEDEETKKIQVLQRGPIWDKKNEEKVQMRTGSLDPVEGLQSEI